MAEHIMADPMCACGHGMTAHRESVLGRAECFECKCENFVAHRPLLCICGLYLAQHGNGCLRPIEMVLPISVAEINEVESTTEVPAQTDICRCGHSESRHAKEAVWRSRWCLEPECNCIEFRGNEARMRELESQLNTMIQNGHTVQNGGTLEVYAGPVGDTSNLIFTMPLRKEEVMTIEAVRFSSEASPVNRCTCGHLPSAHTEQVGGDGVYTKCTECACSNFHAQNMSAEYIGERRERLEQRAAEILGALGDTHARLVSQAVKAIGNFTANFGGTTNVTEDDFTGRPLTENTHHFTPQESDIKHIPEVGFEAKEMVEHPSHYGGADDPYEHIKVCEAKGWGYHIGNCTKYLWRVGLKHADVLEDLRKARWYLDRYITKLEQEQQQTKG